MKDLIKWCIVRHEAEIQELSKSLLGGELFQRIIQRHEMNIAPRPEEPAPKPYAHSLHLCIALIFLYPLISNRSEDERWPSRERTLDREEEDYFNTDDDSELVPSISQKNWILASGATSPLLANNTGMKRKRKTVVGAATKGYRPPLKTPHLGDLVDYGEDEDESTSASEAASSIPLTILSSISTPSTPSASIPATSGPPLKRPSKDDDNEDNLLEALARNTRSRPHSLKPVGAKLGEKRRREEDEQDEQFVRRLSKPNKKPDLGAQKDSSSVGRRRAGEDAKKIKVKLGAIGLSVASTPSSPATTSITESHPSNQQLGTKDGDTG
jgi:protein phosphatase-4 regulatory subunit 3